MRHNGKDWVVSEKANGAPRVTEESCQNDTLTAASSIKMMMMTMMMVENWKTPDVLTNLPA